MSPWFLSVLRLIQGVLAIGVGLWHPFPIGPGQALEAALMTFGFVTLVYFGIDVYWGRLLRSGAFTEPLGQETFVASILTTAGIVLGLLQVFGVGPLSPTLKVASMSLVASLILGMSLFGLVVSASPKGQAAAVFRAAVFNATLSALAFGLLCMAWALVYR